MRGARGGVRNDGLRTTQAARGTSAAGGVRNDGLGPGDQYGIDFPAHAEALRAGGTAFLTTAFHAAGVLAAGNSVTAISRCAEVGGGSTGRKLALSVRYRQPAAGLHTELFVKFSRDFDDPIRDRGRAQMEQEVRLAALALSENFPIAVPRPQFGDYHRESGTGILITERIGFGANGIEPQYQKCLDYRMPDPFGHYRALLTTVARLAGTQQSGRLPRRIVDRFPLDLAGGTVGEQAPITEDKLHRRLSRLAEFATAHTHLLPERVRDPAFLSRLAREAPRVLAQEPAVWGYLAGNPDYIALCHWNANVDNAWFFTDAAGELRCGLMDWGCVGRMNVAMAIWGALCAAETTLWDEHFDDLLQTFADEVRRSGGARSRSRRVAQAGAALRGRHGDHLAARRARPAAGAARTRHRVRDPLRSPHRCRREPASAAADADQRAQPVGESPAGRDARRGQFALTASRSGSGRRHT